MDKENVNLSTETIFKRSPFINALIGEEVSRANIPEINLLN